MSLSVPNQGEAYALELLVNKSSPSNVTLRLYSNNITPGETDTESTYTEVTGSGYAAISLTGSSWTVTPGAPSEASYAQQSFDFSSSFGNVYGYFMTRNSDDKLVWSERFSDGPYNVAAAGQSIKVTPKITAT